MPWANKTRAMTVPAARYLATVSLAAVGIAAVGLATIPGKAHAQEIILRVQNSPLAGYRYYAAPALRSQLLPGEELHLVRDPANPYDANAIKVEWRGQMLGYVPRRQNAALAWIMDRGEIPAARIAPLPAGGKTRRGIEFEVFFR